MKEVKESYRKKTKEGRYLSFSDQASIIYSLHDYFYFVYGIKISTPFLQSVMKFQLGLG